MTVPLIRAGTRKIHSTPEKACLKVTF
jgi:hypothetical protein